MRILVRSEDWHRPSRECAGRILIKPQRRRAFTSAELEELINTYASILIQRGITPDRANQIARQRLIDILREAEVARDLEEAKRIVDELARRELSSIRAQEEALRAMIEERAHEIAPSVVLPPPKPAPSAPRIPYECQVVQHFEYHLDALKEAKERKKKEPDKLYGYAFDPAAQKWAVILCSSFPKTKSAKLIEGLVVIVQPTEEEEEE
jgi:hypothetical protein